MDVIDLAQKLIRFRTETGNHGEIMKCLQFVKSLPELHDAKIDIFEKDNLAPVIFIRNTPPRKKCLLPLSKTVGCMGAALWI